MEGCKERARDAGLSFDKETLEYILTNRDLMELSPKVMIPTLYDYWVHDVEVLREKGKYELYPSNPYETVINTRPAISFYNDNNPDWLNVMIFYHVIGHIDFFQNNLYFRHTWDYDFTGKALSDKRALTKLRSEKGRWVDYIIEFSRSIDNLVGIFHHLRSFDAFADKTQKSRMDYYFDVFLQEDNRAKTGFYVKEVERYNECTRDHGEEAEKQFFDGVKAKYPEFENTYKKALRDKPKTSVDLLQYVSNNSKFLKKQDNVWMKTVMEIVRQTSMYFQPQIRTKILNEGWASYWHEKLFLGDDRIRGHEADFARIHAGVTSMPRVGLNPYALGMRLFSYIEESHNQGHYSYEFEKLKNTHLRKKFDKKTGQGNSYIFSIRENLCDFTFLNDFIEQDFVDKHKAFVTGQRLNQEKMVIEYFVKSRKAREYKQMLMNSLYHPPFIKVNEEKTNDDVLYLTHQFEGKPLVTEYINNTMLGIEFLWGASVKLETNEVVPASAPSGSTPAGAPPPELPPKRKIEWRKVRYTMKSKKLTKEILK